MSKSPDSVDGVKLSKVQRASYRRMVNCLMVQAGWPRADAVRLAEPAFRKSHEMHGESWRAKRDIELQGGHGTIRSCRFWRDENAARSAQ